METVFDSNALPVHERIEAWVEAAASSFVPTHLSFPEETAFEARVKTTDLGAVRLSALSYVGMRSRRTPALIRRSDPEYYQVTLTRTGRHAFDQLRRHSLIPVGHFVVHDTSHPFEGIILPDRPRAESLMLQLPRRLMPLPERQVARLVAEPIPGQGVGRLLAQFLLTVAEEGAGYGARDRVRLAGATVDLVAAMLAHRLERDGDLPPESRQQVLFLRVSAYIQEHLGDPDLGPARIAAAHHISVRHLHRVFRQHSTTVAEFVRARRLDKCRRDLADPFLREVPVHAVAARWGFVQPAAFSRLFRTSTGLTPTEYRAIHAEAVDQPCAGL
ncbi:helix-turn-helix domain-containing protein [Streptomyces cinereoruber]|uniref:helix-turn-helix domain-containing protein n=1 Tax=Streptomyces cinereoruber TaxID=67260 RepID=UPI00345D13D2